MADYTTHSGNGGVWLILAGVAVAIILLFVAFAGGGGNSPSVETLGAETIAPAPADSGASSTGEIGTPLVTE